MQNFGGLLPQDWGGVRLGPWARETLLQAGYEAQLPFWGHLTAAPGLASRPHRQWDESLESECGKAGGRLCGSRMSGASGGRAWGTPQPGLGQLRSHTVNSATLRGQSRSSLSKFKKGLGPTSQGEKCQRILWPLEKMAGCRKVASDVACLEPQGGAWTKPALGEVGLARPLKAV